MWNVGKTKQNKHKNLSGTGLKKWTSYTLFENVPIVGREYFHVKYGKQHSEETHRPGKLTCSCCSVQMLCY